MFVDGNIQSELACAQEGAKVLVEVFTCEGEQRTFDAEVEASERTLLEHDNNYRWKNGGGVCLAGLWVGKEGGLAKHVLWRIVRSHVALRSAAPHSLTRLACACALVLLCLWNDTDGLRCRCGWPELSQRPVTFSGGLRVVFSVMGGISASHMMGQQEMGAAIRAGSVTEDEVRGLVVYSWLTIKVYP